MAIGAATELDKSPLAGVMTHYEKIMMINAYFGLNVKAPTVAQSRLAVPLQESPYDIPTEEGCSGVVILGGARRTASPSTAALRTSTSSRRSTWSRTSFTRAIRMPIRTR